MFEMAEEGASSGGHFRGFRVAYLAAPIRPSGWSAGLPNLGLGLFRESKQRGKDQHIRKQTILSRICVPATPGWVLGARCPYSTSFLRDRLSTEGRNSTYNAIRRSRFAQKIKP